MQWCVQKAGVRMGSGVTEIYLGEITLGGK